MLSILIGCGLRRSELAAIEVDHVQLRQGHWVIVDLVGKGGHIRTVPVAQWVKDSLGSTPPEPETVPARTIAILSHWQSLYHLELKRLSRASEAKRGAIRRKGYFQRQQCKFPSVRARQRRGCGRTSGPRVSHLH